MTYPLFPLAFVVLAWLLVLCSISEHMPRLHMFFQQSAAVVGGISVTSLIAWGLGFIPG